MQKRDKCIVNLHHLQEKCVINFILANQNIDKCNGQTQFYKFYTNMYIKKMKTFFEKMLFIEVSADVVYIF